MRSTRLLMLFLLSGLLFTSACKKVEKEMLVTTGSISDILTTSADVSGEILDLGEGATQYGHCWSTTASPTVSDTKTELGIPEIGDFTSNMTSLTPNTKYYIKAYISRGKDIVYGNEISFSTIQLTVPQIITTAVSNITDTGAESGGTISYDGGSSVTKRGVCWSLKTNPTIAYTDSITVNGSGTGNFPSNISGLTPGLEYYLRAYATNSSGTAYGPEVTFTTLSLPVVTTSVISSITPTSALCGGEVTFNGGTSIITRGVCYDINVNPTVDDSRTQDGNSTGSFTSELKSLIPNKKYYARSYATNSVGTAYGNETFFTTLNPAIIVFSFVGSQTGWADVDFTYISTNANVSTYEISNRSFIQNEEFLIKKNHSWDDQYGYDDLIIFGEADNFGNSTSPSNDQIVVLSARTYDVFFEIDWFSNAVSLIMNNLTPKVATIRLSDINAISGFCHGDMVNSGSSSISAKGVCWSTSQYPTIGGSHVDCGNALTSFYGYMSGLVANTFYYARTYATNSFGTSYGTEIYFNSGYAFKASYAGGVVFYNDGNGHGLVCAPSNQSTGALWGCTGTLISGADGTAVGTGNQNTTDIVNGCTTSGIPAKICYDLSLNGYTDWYLPSKDELEQMATHLLGLDVLTYTGIYWSSTEYDSEKAWSRRIDFYEPATNSKSNAYYVRAIRAF